MRSRLMAFSRTLAAPSRHVSGNYLVSIARIVTNEYTSCHPKLHKKRSRQHKINALIGIPIAKCYINWQRQMNHI